MRSVCGRSPGGQRAWSCLPRFGDWISSLNLYSWETKGRQKFVAQARRMGVEVAARGQVWGPLYFNGSVTYTKAEFRNGDAIPLAPEVTAYGALLLRWPEGLTSQLQATYLGARPLVEDRSVKSSSWIDFDLSERYQLPIKLSHGRLEAFLFVQNLFNTKWEQAIFAFESQLRNEAAPVNGIHFVPGNPRYVPGRRGLVLLTAAENGRQLRSRLANILNVPQRVHLRCWRRLRPRWMTILSSL